MNPMMKCGHAANAVDKANKPCCAICTGIDPGADVVDANPPKLEGRAAKCAYCPTEKPSSPELAFFEERTYCPKDAFYCGCRGWD